MSGTQREMYTRMMEDNDGRQGVVRKSFAEMLAKTEEEHRERVEEL